MTKAKPPNSAIQFHNCDTEESKAACCVYFLSLFYGVTMEQMATCCNMAKLLRPELEAQKGERKEAH